MEDKYIQGKMIMDSLRKIPVANLVIPHSLINPRPDQTISMRKISVPFFFGHEEYYSKRMAEIEYEVSERSFYYP